jgi:D-glycero-D-manno-heptose 1,7-bisphosphate phosphatase
MEKFSYALVCSPTEGAPALSWEVLSESNLGEAVKRIRESAGKVLLSRNKYLKKIDWSYFVQVAANSDATVQGMRLVSDYIGGRLWYPNSQNRPTPERPYLYFEKMEGEEFLSGFRNLPVYLMDSQKVSINMFEEILSGDDSYQLAPSIQGIPLAVYEDDGIAHDGILFLDRDGVINEDRQYVFKKEEIQFMPGIFELIGKANKSGRKVVVVTNQSGIGRGYYTEQDVLILHGWMNDQMKAHGVVVDGWYYSAEHPQGNVSPLRGRGVFRKPYPGMFLQAAQDLKQSLLGGLMIGDKLSDMPMQPGITTYLLKGQYPLKQATAYDSLAQIMNLL